MAELPDGASVPADGPLSGVDGGRFAAGEATFSVYLHVPYCRVRCGYCDFNTYTALELGGGASQQSYAATAVAEIGLAAGEMASAGVRSRPARTVFFGGGTPTVLPAADLARMLAAVRETWGIATGAEVTTEANPDTVDARYMEDLAAAGFTRVSLGMQSAVPHVLATLERTHAPENVPHAVRAARAAGLDVSVDLIYGTPGESMDDWRRSLDAALATEPDHVSAYALGIEEGTRLAARVRRGEVAPTDADDQAEKYAVADAALTAAGLTWYEISNWARPGHECRHNLAYWRGEDWWGIGPGAHSHFAGLRFWNLKHPRAYAQRLADGRSPAAGRELLDEQEREFERIMLGVRLAGGLDLAGRRRGAPRREERARLAQLVEQGLAEPGPAADGVVRLTLRGRLLADAVTRELTD